MRKAVAVAQVTILESFRRKDPYVVLILGFLIVLGAGLFNYFGVQGLDKFVKDVRFSVINIFCVIICVMAAARQLPTEIQQRTLYPLIAKPVRRSTVFLGKFVGVGVMSSAVVLIFSLELLLLFLLLNISVSGVFFQAVYLRIVSMWFISALVLFLSLVLTPAGNVTISLLLCLTMQTLTNTILTVQTELEGISLTISRVLYWILPHLELFDLSKKEIHGWPTIPAWVLLAMTLYGAIYSGIFLVLGCLQFGRRSL